MSGGGGGDQDMDERDGENSMNESEGVHEDVHEGDSESVDDSALGASTCSTCQKEFMSLKGLGHHIRDSHSISGTIHLDGNVSLTLKRNKDRIFHCNGCQADIKTLGGIKKHLQANGRCLQLARMNSLLGGSLSQKLPLSAPQNWRSFEEGVLHAHGVEDSHENNKLKALLISNQLGLAPIGLSIGGVETSVTVSQEIYDMLPETPFVILANKSKQESSISFTQNAVSSTPIVANIIRNSTCKNILSTRSFEELDDKSINNLNMDWARYFQAGHIAASIISGCIITNNRDGKTILVNEVEVYGRDSMLDCHREETKNQKGVEGKNSIPSTTRQEYYDGIRPVTLRCRDGVRLVIGTNRPPNNFLFTKAINEVNVARQFYNYQKASTVVVNNPNIKANMNNFGQFLSMNYIWDLDVQMSGLDEETYLTIKKLMTWPRSLLSQEARQLCDKLDQQFIEGVEIQGDGFPSIVLLYKMLYLKLPVEYLSFETGIEDTYCHGVIDALFSMKFPSRSVYRVNWANKMAEGSKDRRGGDGYKPDAIISRYGNELTFVEIKPPKSEHSTKSYLDDQWKLANFCKDAIDRYLRNGIEIRKLAALQIFGHRMILFTMVYEYGIYHWSKTCTSYIPCDQSDIRRLVPSLELVNTLEDFLDSIDANPTPRTPQRIEYDGSELETEDRGRPTGISPTKRSMF
ncbi:hypothetical protein BGZ76_003713 [Entomortierella beljakovae]|nr:hypothetical protein BGZ76_003713 [Entomortierella beljakovae]